MPSRGKVQALLAGENIAYSKKIGKSIKKIKE
jgi:hypothetical protein